MPYADGEWRDADPERSARARRSRAPFPRIFTFISRIATRGRTVEVFKMLSVNGRIFRPFIAYNSRLMPFGKLDRVDTEAVILRVAWRCGSRYEWSQHVPIARRAGITDDGLDSIKSGGSQGLADRTVALLQATDELLDDHVISDDTWNSLRIELSPAQIVELGLLAGHYAALAGVLNSMGVPVEHRTASAVGV